MPHTDVIPALAIQNHDYWAEAVYVKMIVNRSQLNCLARCFIPIAPANSTEQQLTTLAAKARDYDRKLRYGEWIPGIGTLVSVRQIVYALSMPTSLLENKCNHLARAVLGLIPVVGSLGGLAACIETGIIEDPS